MLYIRKLHRFVDVTDRDGVQADLAGKHGILSDPANMPTGVRVVITGLRGFQLSGLAVTINSSVYQRTMT